MRVAVWYQVLVIACTSSLLVAGGHLRAQEPAVSPWEKAPAGEAARIEHVVELTSVQLRNRYAGQKAVKRGVHAKDHGCVKAHFQVADALADEYRVGIFAVPGKKYEAWVRFSNAATLVLPDDLPDEQGRPVPGSRGMAIKVLGVQGDSLVPLHGALTQDFLMVNHPVFAFAIVEDYEVLSTVIADPANQERPNKFFAIQTQKGGAAAARAKRSGEIVSRIRSTDVTAFQPQPKSPVDCRYFSGAPFAFGPNAVMKYAVTPVDPDKDPPADTSAPNYLRQALKDRLGVRDGNRPVVFQFQVQKRDPQQLNLDSDIEDACTEWAESEAPFQTVATLTIEPQDFDDPARLVECESLFFTPWHGIKEFQPLGGINRMRKAVYEASSNARHHPKEPEKF